MGTKEKEFFPVVIGTNHRFSSLSFRDKLFFDDSVCANLLVSIKQAGIKEVIVLSTCDRLEIYAIHNKAYEVANIATSKISDFASVDLKELQSNFYQYTQAEAIQHIFRVAASLDSAVIGEPQILGQLKAAHRHARNHESVGSMLETIMQAAYEAAKFVRTKTAIGERSISIASAAVDVARDIFGNLERSGILLIGGGNMGELVAEELMLAGARRIKIIDPIKSRAISAVKRMNAQVAEFSDIDVLAKDAEIIISGIGTQRIILTADFVKANMLARRRKNQFIIDIGIPGDVDPAVNFIDDAFLYDLAELEKVAAKGQLHREKQAELAANLIEEEVLNFLSERAAREAIPLVARLRDQFEKERQRALIEGKGDADKATRLLLNRLLHGPTVTLKRAASQDSAWAQKFRWTERLFRLPPEDDDEGTGV